jgi:cell division protein FtsI (penicillin-binding protein 3)
MTKPITQNTKLIKVRLVIVWLILIAGMFGLIYRLYKLQIIGVINSKDNKTHDLAAEALRQRQYELTPYIPRRPIIDRYNNTLAMDRIVYTLYVHPKLFKHKPLEVAQALQTVFTDQKIDQLLKIFREKETGILLRRNLSESEARQIRLLKIPKQTEDGEIIQTPVDGLDLVSKNTRFYPQENTVSDVIGYVQLDSRKGQAGIESSQEKLLAKEAQVIRLIRDGQGNLMPLSHQEEIFENFDDLKLQLTLALPLQRAARTALQDQLKEAEAKRGAVIVMDVHDGSILTMVSEPSYDPNNYSQFDISLFKNWAISDLYEPGSTFKPINMALAFEAGVIDDNTTVNDTGKTMVDGWPILNHDFGEKGARGMLNLGQILQYSSNIGMIRIMERINSATYYEKLKNLGLEQITGIDLPGEVAGKLKDKKVFTRGNIEAATASFGQGFSVTPLKILQLQAAIANGGKLVTPHVVQGLVDPKGKYQWQPELKTKQIFPPHIARKVLQLMETVVTDGSGQVAQVKGYRIAGKTGTAQKASPTGGYLANAKITSFVAIVPVDKPRYAMIVVVDEPKKPHSFGSTVAAPIAQKVLNSLLFQEKIPPSN